MDNLNILFSSYIKDLKLSASEEYVYVTRDDFFGDIIFSYNSSCLNMTRCNGISNKYMNKIISVEAIKTNFYFEYDFGYMFYRDSILAFDCRRKLSKAMEVLNGFKNDIRLSDNVQHMYELNDPEQDFYNNILSRKSGDGAGRYIFGDKVIYMAPCMLPGSKSTGLDAIGYQRNGNDYFVIVFNTHKKERDIMTLIRLLSL